MDKKMAVTNDFKQTLMYYYGQRSNSKSKIYMELEKLQNIYSWDVIVVCDINGGGHYSYNCNGLIIDQIKQNCMRNEKI